jgi:hypothetical protein
MCSPFLFFFLIRYFLHSHLQCYPKSPPYPPNPLSPALRHIKSARPMGLSFHWWLTRPSSDTYAARDMSSGGGEGGALVSSYCCSTHRVAVPLSSLGTLSSSSIGGPVIHPIADCEHPLLCLPGPCIVSQDTAISGSFQLNLASVCNGVSIWKLMETSCLFHSGFNVL